MRENMSELLFLGTGAHDWSSPNEDGFFRRYSAALVNDDLMIDCGKYVFDFAQSVNRNDLYDNVTDLIITHQHDDHFCRDTVLKLAQNRKLRVGCDGNIQRQIGDHPNIEFVHFEQYEWYDMGRYKIMPLLSNHDVIVSGDARAFHYIVETPDGKKLFYGLDGAWYLRPSWSKMQKHRFDVMVLDCAVGDMHDWRIFEHNTIPMLRMMTREIRERNMLTDDGRIFVSHMAKTLHKSHEDTQSILKEIDVIAAYDGMKVVF